MIQKTLGKIESIRFGYGGYDDAMFGLSVTLSHDGYGVSDFIGTWSISIKVTEHTKWSESDRSKTFDEVMRKVNQLLIDAKVTDVYQLKGKPVEVTTEGMALKSWRLLTEVL